MGTVNARTSSTVDIALGGFKCWPAFEVTTRAMRLGPRGVKTEVDFPRETPGMAAAARFRRARALREVARCPRGAKRGRDNDPVAADINADVLTPRCASS